MIISPISRSINPIIRPSIGMTSVINTQTVNSFKFVTNKYISVPTSSDFDFGSGNFAFSFWIYRNTTARCFFFNRVQSGSVYTQFEIQSSSLIQFGISSLTDWTITPTTSIPTGEWVHCLFQRNGANVEFYMNGSANGSGSSSGALPVVSAQIEIHADVFDSLYPNLDSINYYIFNDSLTISEINELYGSGIQPEFSILSGSLKSKSILAIEASSRDDSGNDLSGSGNNGVKNGGITYDGQQININIG